MRWQKVFHANGNQKEAGVAILISDKINFKPKIAIKDKEAHCIDMMTKHSVHQESITIVNIYIPQHRNT